MADTGSARDVDDICTLKARYFRFADTKQWAELRALFTEDATLDFPEAWDAPKPLDQALAVFRQSLSETVSVHHGHCPEISFTSPDRATGIWAMEDRLFFTEKGAAQSGLLESHGYGHYHESYVRQAGVWKISTLRLTRLRVQKIPAPRSYG